MADTIDTLAAALARAQARIGGAKKDSLNPHFKSAYADLASVWEACRDALTSEGLSVAQFCREAEGGWVLVTRLLHAGGEVVEGEIPLLNGKGDMQGLGSAITYARRYGLAAMVGVSPEDDDGNAASVTSKSSAIADTPKMVKPAGYDDWRDDFVASAATGLDALKAAWAETSDDMRGYWLAHEPKDAREKLRAKAAAVSVHA